METKKIIWNGMEISVTGEYVEAYGPDPDKSYSVFVVSRADQIIAGNHYRMDLTSDQVDEIAAQVEQDDRMEGAAAKAEFIAEGW